MQQFVVLTRPYSVTMSEVGSARWPDELIALYRGEYRQLVRLSASMLGSSSEAEEVVQDAIVALRQRWDQVDAPKAYLRRSVVNGSIGVLRRRPAAVRVGTSPSPAEAPRELVELRDLLLRLPERQRAAVVLRFVAGLDDEAIAHDLGVRRATVRSLVARALRSLRQELDGGVR